MLTSWCSVAAGSQIVITAGHGGTLKPSSMVNRPANGCYNSTNDECIYQSGCSSALDKSKCGVKSQYSDQNTQHLATELADHIQAKLGGTSSLTHVPSSGWLSLAIATDRVCTLYSCAWCILDVSYRFITVLRLALQHYHQQQFGDSLGVSKEKIKIRMLCKWGYDSLNCIMRLICYY